MNTDNLTFVNFCTVTEEQLTAILQTEQRERDRFTLTVRDQYAVLTLTHFTRTYVVVVAEGGVQQTSTGSHGHELRTEANQTTAWDHVVETYAAFTVWIHVFQVAFTFAQRLHYRTLMLFFNVQSHVFIRLLFTTVDFTEDNFRTGYRQFETFTTHVFDQNRQVQFATTRNAERIGVFGFFYAQRNVVYQFFVQTIQDLTRRYELTFFTAERRGVNAEEHRNGRLINGECRQRFNVLRVANGVRNVQFAKARDRNDIASFRQIGFDTFQTEVAQHFTDFRVAGFAFAIDDSDLLVRLHFTALDAANADNANIAVVIELRNLHLERTVKVNVRRRNVVNNRLIQRGHVFRHIFVVQTRDTVQRRSVNDREVQLLVGRVEVNEQIEYLIHNPIRTRARAVNFVDNNNRLQAVSKRFFGYEARLRHRAVKCVNHQQH